jgi:hypothetical protein
MGLLSISLITLSFLLIKTISKSPDNETIYCTNETIIFGKTIMSIGIGVLATTVMLSYLVYKYVYKRKNVSFSF